MSDSEKAQLRSLFNSYDTINERLEAAKEEVTRITAERSQVLENILDAAGPGPYNRGGRILKIVRRGDTLFFRGKGDKESIEV